MSSARSEIASLHQEFDGLKELVLELIQLAGVETHHQGGSSEEEDENVVGDDGEMDKNGLGEGEVGKRRGSENGGMRRGSGSAEERRGSGSAEERRGSGSAEKRRGSGSAEKRRGSGMSRNSSDGDGHGRGSVRGNLEMIHDLLPLQVPSPNSKNSKGMKGWNSWGKAQVQGWSGSVRSLDGGATRISNSPSPGSKGVKQRELDELKAEVSSLRAYVDSKASLEDEVIKLREEAELMRQQMQEFKAVATLVHTQAAQSNSFVKEQRQKAVAMGAAPRLEQTKVLARGAENRDKMLERRRELTAVGERKEGVEKGAGGGGRAETEGVGDRKGGGEGESLAERVAESLRVEEGGELEAVIEGVELEGGDLAASAGTLQRTLADVQSLISGTQGQDGDEQKEAMGGPQPAEGLDSDPIGKETETMGGGLGSKVSMVAKCGKGVLGGGVLCANWCGGGVVTGGVDGAVRVWGGEGASEEGAWRQIWKGEGRHGGSEINAVESRGDVIASGGEDGAVMLWGAAAGEDLGGFETKGDQAGAEDDGRGVTCLVSDSDGNRFFVGVQGGNEILCYQRDEPGSGWTFMGRMKGHMSWVTCLCLVMDGRFLASSSYDASVRVWAVSSFHQFCARH